MLIHDSPFDFLSHQRGGTLLEWAVRHIQIGFIQRNGFDQIGEFIEDAVNLRRNRPVRIKPGPEEHHVGTEPGRHGWQAWRNGCQ